MKDGIDQYLISLFNHSGNHYRHLEKQRNQYLGFYFTLLIGLLAVTFNILSKITPENTFIALVSIEAILMMVILIGSILLAAVKKTGYALKKHANVMASIDELLLANTGKTKASFMKGYDSTHPSENDPVLNVQKSSHYIISILGFFLLIAYFALFIHIFSEGIILVNMVAGAVGTILLGYHIVVSTRKVHGIQ